jgi:hypothetical protein
MRCLGKHTFLVWVAENRAVCLACTLISKPHQLKSINYCQKEIKNAITTTDGSEHGSLKVTISLNIIKYQHLSSSFSKGT